MHDPSRAQVGTRRLAGSAAASWARAGAWAGLRPWLNAVSAVGAVLFLMSSADLDTPIPYVCGAAALLSALGAELAR